MLGSLIFAVASTSPDRIATFLGNLNTVALIASGTVGLTLLLLPGWVLANVYAQGVRGPTPSDRALLLTTALGGIVVHALALAWTLALARELISDGLDRHVLAVIVWVLAVLVCLPAVIGAGLNWLSAEMDTVPSPMVHGLAAALGVTATVRTTDAWTWAFRRRTEGCFVRITLKGAPNQQILGRFDVNSLASSDPSVRDIFVEDVWAADKDGWFEYARPGNQGAWVTGDQIDSIEFFEGTT